MPMTSSALLTLTQWLSPAFPVSAYAYSHGLEHVIDTGRLRSASDLQHWLTDIIQMGGGRSDAVMLSAAYKADTSALHDIDATARAFAASAERLTETVDQGAAFSRTVESVWGISVGPLCYPVAVGRAASLQDIPLLDTLDVFVHAFAGSLTSAAVRLVPLGQTEGQAVLSGLAPVIQEVAKTAALSKLDDLSTACFALDIAAMNHETQYSKVFRT